MNSIKVSIIIPVYNGEAFLQDCIKSLINQTLIACEFIFVNDGSTDNSIGIIQGYQKKDSRIIVISQINKGISEARNTGIAVAKGEYIGFLDNDDFVKDDMFEHLYETAQHDNLDIVVSKTILGRDGKYIIKDPVFDVGILYAQPFIQAEIIPNLLKTEDLFAVWNKIYKRSFVDLNNIHFPKNRVIEEDNMFNIQAFNKAEKIVFIDYAGYYYREVATSKSRLTIENDYFSKALEKYYFDYKKEYNLTLPDSEIEELKAVRFIQRVFYLLYKCAVTKTSLKIKYNYIKRMVFHAKVYEIAKKYNQEVIADKGIYERIVLKVITKKSSILLFFLILTIQIGYHPVISETIRKLNKLTKNN
ncbi:glycosyltransferase [Flavobacterium sp. CLA17]|uniref:glycosyltransferase n=1 Tax=Flavobacterium sp. CLA17 TaxID=2724135 RepID=UPI001490993D|nr:glycosyltransferase [Flavobacterium sp. CLA17]QSB27326.1 glycosyltransferase [Flavobacterium sp. CLA17]